MLNSSWNNPWKLTSLGLGLVAATALATGLVVANRTGKESDKTAAVEVGARRPPPPYRHRTSVLRSTSPS